MMMVKIQILYIHYMHTHTHLAGDKIEIKHLHVREKE